jgi:translation initiation factor 4E
MASSLPGPAAQASKAALAAALAENEKSTSDATASSGATADDGEGQELEVNMEQQADNIRTVFSDPSNFNVKVTHNSFSLRHYIRHEHPVNDRKIFVDW